MNFKHLFPTFRNRFRFVRGRVSALAQQQTFDRALNLGTGEGDYDRMLAGFTREIIGCDVNEEDIKYAASMNQGVMNLRYEVNNALDLTYPTGYFDLIVSSEVIEHVGQPAQMIKEIHRVLAPGGYAVLTFPSREFPWSYDPVNRIWQLIRKPGSKENLIAQGGYAFGHDYLIGSADFKQWVEAIGLEIVEFKPLSGWLVGLLEMYWTGIVQSIFKKNSRNVTTDTSNALKVRPADTKEPALAILTDAVLWLDALIFSAFGRSVGKGVVLRKK
jgi:SAM-dependent methyltransferase